MPSNYYNYVVMDVFMLVSGKRRHSRSQNIHFVHISLFWKSPFRALIYLIMLILPLRSMYVGALVRVIGNQQKLNIIEYLLTHLLHVFQCTEC